jgi:tetratricopeptide (TPR) repeat protein
MHQRALKLRQNAFGPNHPDVAQSISNLAVVYHSQGEYKEAESQYKVALAILQKHLRVDSEDYVIISENYADLLRATGRERKAAQVEERARACQQR